jgi:hypothetical protein
MNILVKPAHNQTLWVNWSKRTPSGTVAYWVFLYAGFLSGLKVNPVQNWHYEAGSVKFKVLKSANTSLYQNRYDKFTVSLSGMPTGSYEYIVYAVDADAVMTENNCLGVVDTGVMQLVSNGAVEVYDPDVVSIQTQTEYYQAT